VVGWGGGDAPHRPEDDAQLVHEDLLAGPVGLRVGGVDHLAQLGHHELMAEDGELHGEVADFVERRLAGGEPAGVGVVHNHGVVVDERLDLGAE
jgi:hypothetical protein